jgi:hypothetical protein
VSLALRELFRWVLLLECLMKSWDSRGSDGEEFIDTLNDYVYVARKVLW